jgi:hypothetical protein
VNPLAVPTLVKVEILLWLVPPAVVTVVAMVWVTWLGRQGRREVDREAAVRRLGEALSDERRARRPTSGYAPRVPLRDRSSGVAVRPSRMKQPAPDPDQPEQERRAG